MRSLSIGSFAFVQDTKPLNSVLLFHIDDDCALYFATHENTYKAQALVTNPQVSFSVWEHKKMLVQGAGEAHPVENISQRDTILERIVGAVDNIDSFWPPVLRIKNNTPYVVYKVSPSWLRTLDLSEDTITSADDPYTEIDLTKG